jgi:aerobic C4-dicarboxylate transport protein
LAYFEVVSTLALIIGIVVAEVIQPGGGFNIDPATLDPKSVSGFVNRAKQEDVVTFLMRIIPDTFVGAFTGGSLLQTILVSVLTGFAISRMGEFGRKVTAAIEMAGKVAFGIIAMISKAAPIGALGAIAFTIGAFGIGSLWNLGQVILTFYLTALLFILVVLGTIARAAGFSILRYLAYVKDELLIVFATSSSEAAMPQTMEKLEKLGISKSIVGLVFPTGYSFNADGSSIYLTLCIFFLAQATNTHIPLTHMLGILAFAMVTSKGGTGVSGGGFVTLAATLAAAPEIPIQALALLLGIDKFMGECRGLTNIIGNGVATIVVSRWEGELDPVKLRAAMAAAPAAAAAPLVKVPAE